MLIDQQRQRHRYDDQGGDNDQDDLYSALLARHAGIPGILFGLVLGHNCEINLSCV
jgi:hypothetical protein